MGAMFRSEEMSLAQLFLQPEAAYFVISEMGEAGCVQFRDLNVEVNAFQRKYASEIKRCDEMERKLRYIESEVKKDRVHIPDIRDLPKAPNPREIIDLEYHLEKTEREIKELSENYIRLKMSYSEINEQLHVIEKTQLFFNEQGTSIETVQRKFSVANDSEYIPDENHSMGFVAGVISRERLPAFERMIWRISKGNVFIKQSEVSETFEDPASGLSQQKVVFLAFYQGLQLDQKIRKICTGFRAHTYPCPKSLNERNSKIQSLRTELADITLVLNKTKDLRQRVLSAVAKDLQGWSVMVRKMKAIYYTLNMFNIDISKKCLIGECWLPTSDIPTVNKALAEGSRRVGSPIPSFLNIIETKDTAPTFTRTNKFTRGFQNLIDAYGVASYREANPGLYTIVTFPFLFAVMFGDVGHAIIMLSFGLWLVLSEEKIAAQKNKSEIFSIFFGGRYIILLMGLFSLYTGFIYNDVFSKSINIFRSSWKVEESQLKREWGDSYLNYSEADSTTYVQLVPKDSYVGTPYFMGLDPVWHQAKNNIIFLNSYKMKLSIVFGIVHMVFGVTVSTINYVHFKKYSSLVLEFIPQILLLFFLFVYLVIMMFMKWILYSGVNDGIDAEHGTSCAPSVLIYFINMMLLKYSSNVPDETCVVNCCKTYMFPAQPKIEMVLVAGALLCIPTLLLGKPLYIMRERKKKRQSANLLLDNGTLHLETLSKPSTSAGNNHAKINGGFTDDEENFINEKITDQDIKTALVSAARKDEHGHAEHDEEPMSEIFIHQAIHTIEYVLSTISHTASYLRLWALSLAHAQLSDVLWTMVLQKALALLPGYPGVILLYPIFAVWAVFTVAILVLMEGLSAFLHTLRLHWVEFMSKFFEGTGYVFQPFSFKVILDDEEE